ncbi:MAG: hypothetical protein HFH42_09315 [Lachnospiraceae bacterium]|nr:hypothetical protein [Lachnospiraceae bacterium]
MAMEKRDAKVTPVKTTTAKAAEAKEEAVAAATVKAEEPKKAAEEKKETVKKEATAKKAVKKSPAKKTETKKAEKVEEIYLQFHGQEIFTKEIMEKAKRAYIAEGHRESSIKSIRLYIKPEENMAYYVINEKIAGGVAL